MTNDDPRFQTARVVERNLGPAETERLNRGAMILASIVGVGAEKAFYQSFSRGCGDALPTAMVQLLSFVEARANQVVCERDPGPVEMLRAWRAPGMMNSIYLNACVEDYARDKAWAQTSDAEKERGISLERFGDRLSEGSLDRAIDKAKETGIALCLAAGLSFATDSMSLAEKLPHAMREALTEAAKSGMQALSMLCDLSAHNMESAALGVVLAGAAVLGKSLLSAAWTAWREKAKREDSAYELPRSLVIMDRDHAWEPHVLGLGELARGLRLNVVPPVWDSGLLPVLSENRRAIRAYVALAAAEVKQTWSLLSNEQRKSSKDMPADEAIAIAAGAIRSMRERAEKGGYGSLDYASLDKPERERLAQAAFDKARSEEPMARCARLPADPLSVKQRLLARRPVRGGTPWALPPASS